MTLAFIMGTLIASGLICGYERGWGQTVSLIKASHCTVCHIPIGWKNLIPLWSWFYIKGRCRQCGSRLSFLYPVTELFGGLWAWVLWSHHKNMNWVTLGMVLAMGLVFLLILYHDIIIQRIPDLFILFIAGGGLILKAELLTSLILGIIVCVVGWCYLYCRDLEGLGRGDIKLFWACGLYLPPESIGFFLIMAGCLGILFGKAWQYRHQQTRFPFAPPLIISFAGLFLFRLARFTNSGILEKVYHCIQ